jgi:N,N'-diacetyllegionaminate synthase
MLIAECCQNHLGDPETLYKMVEAGASAGATHLKIQGLYSDELTLREQFEVNRKPAFSDYILRPHAAEFARLKPLTLGLDIEKGFVEKCRLHNVTPMISVFSHLGVDRAIKAGFRSFKIASYDCASIELISRLLPHSDELVISTGATYWHEIAATVKFIEQNKLPETQIIFLHAVTEYPTLNESVRLLRMAALRRFGFEVGFSDHTSPQTSGLAATALAIKLGARAIERHFTILDTGATKDGPVSVDPAQLEQISKMFQHPSYLLDFLPEEDELISMLAPLNSLEPSEIELKNREYYRGRVASIYRDKHIYSWEHWPSEA